MKILKIFVILLNMNYIYASDLSNILLDRAMDLKNDLKVDLLIDLSIKLLGNYKKQKETEKISSLQEKRCPFYPSCSIYATESIKKYGFFIGVIIAWDRLYYRHNENVFEYYDFFIKEGQVYAYDPVYDINNKQKNFFSPFDDDDSIDPVYLYRVIR